MAEHKFKIGDLVTYSKPYVTHSEGPYEVIRLAPSDTAEPAYRIKSSSERHERVVEEHEITLAHVH